MTEDQKRNTYRRLYQTRPWQIGSTRIAVGLLLSPILLPLAVSRVLFFILFNGLFLLLPPGRRGFVPRAGLLCRIAMFLSCGIIYRTNFPLGGSRVDRGGEDETRGRQLVVFNHHGVCDIFLFPLFNQLGIASLIVSYPVDYYRTMRRWVFFFDHTFDLIHHTQVRRMILAARTSSLALFPEGAGKKGRGVLHFNPALYALYSRVQPYSVRMSYALPLYDYYGTDLPLYKVACYVCLAVSPWTIFNIERLPPIDYGRNDWASAAEASRRAIAQSANEPLLGMMFDQQDYDRYVMDIGVSHEIQHGRQRAP
ncbi:MAG: hypothetical protein U0236_09700 [Nitrospira sp.]